MVVVNVWTGEADLSMPGLHIQGIPSEPLVAYVAGLPRKFTYHGLLPARISHGLGSSAVTVQVTKDGVVGWVYCPVKALDPDTVFIATPPQASRRWWQPRPSPFPRVVVTIYAA